MGTYQHEEGSTDAVIIHEPSGKRCEDEHANAGAAQGDARRQRFLSIEIEVDGDYRRRVHHAETQSGDDARRHEQRLHRCSQKRGAQPDAAHQTSQYDHSSEAHAVCQRRTQRTYQSSHN